MSYCRKGPESDVYVIAVEADEGPLTATLITTHAEAELIAQLPMRLVCHDCSLLPFDDYLDEHGEFAADSHAAMLAHLAEHAAAGHQVPDTAIERLRRESGESN